MSDNKQKNGPAMPPVPRDYDEASYSELVPIKSTSINIFKSPIFYMVAVTAVATIALFNSRVNLLTNVTEETFVLIGFISIGYLLLMALLIIFLYARTDKPFWVYLIPFFGVVGIMMTGVMGLYFFVFRDVLPGGPQWINSQQFIQSFIGMFFGAGLCEELIKVTPALMLAYISLQPDTWESRLGSVWYDRLRIRGPLDGLLMGLFGGAAFILIETGIQYVPGALRDTYNATGDVGAGLASALLLLMPRTIGGIVGHMAWAGITGYFIGLWVLRPSTGWKVMLYAWIGSSALHAMWNTQNFVPLFSYLSAGASGAFLVACLLKARQLATAAGRVTDSYGSIVVGAQPAGAAPSIDQSIDQTNSGANRTSNPPAPVVDTAAPRNPPQSSAPTEGSSSNPDLQQATNKSGGQASSVTSVPAALQLVVGGVSVPVAVGPLVIPGLADLSAEVTSHPTRPDVLGLKNTSQGEWRALLRDGSEQVIGHGRNIRLAPGVKIFFSDDLVCEVVGA